MKNTISSYKNGNTIVTIYDDGTKIREIFKDGVPKYPESIDVKITNWCDAGCAWCHEKSTKSGNHADLNKLIDILIDLPKGTELAIGGGHPLSHPDFEDFIIEMTAHGLICNVTVNEHHFLKEFKRIQKYTKNEWIRGVGYSYKSQPCPWHYEHLVTHLIIGVHDFSVLNEIVKYNKKILLLGYKEFGRGVKYKNIDANIEKRINYWYRMLWKAVDIAHISMDNLAVKQLNPARMFANEEKYKECYMGDDGTYTMYIDAVNQQFAKSSTSCKRQKFNDLKIDEMFKEIRNENP